MVKRTASLLWAKSGSVGWAAAVIAAASVASRLVGILRDRLLSGTFGAGTQLDAYYAAFRFPDFIFNLIVLGAVGAGFVPIMSGYLAKDGGREGPEAESWEFVRLLTTVFGVVLTALSVVCFIAAPVIVPIITPGFDAAAQELTVTLSRIMFLGGPILGLSSVLGSVLQAQHRFLAFALSPVLYNFGIIAGVWLLGPTYGIVGAAIGVLVGIVLHFSVQYVAVVGAGFRLGWRLRWRDQGLKDVVRLAVPRTVSLALGQVNLMFVTGIATTLGVGALAVFNLAYNLEMAPVGIIGISFAVASFPVVSALAARGQMKELAEEFNRSVRAVLYLALPATVLLLLLRAQAVRLVFGTGAFDWSDTVATADTLAYFSLSLFAQSLVPLVSRTFFALRDVKTTLVAVVAGIVVERATAAVLVGNGWGETSLAIGWSVGTVVNLAILWLALRHRIGSLGERRLFRDLALMSVAGVAAAFGIQATKNLVGGAVDMQTFVGVLTQAASAGGVGVLIYAMVTYAFGLAEARTYLCSAGRRVARLHLGRRWPWQRKQVECAVALEGLAGQATGGCETEDTKLS